MITASAVLVLLGAVLLVLGLVDGDDGVGLLLGSIVACVAAAVLLAVGVARMRPRPGGALAGSAPAWSGARADAARAADGKDGDDDERLAGVLADVPEVGAVERRALLEHFGGYRWLRVASVDAIATVPGIDADVAERVHARLQD